MDNWYEATENVYGMELIRHTYLFVHHCIFSTLQKNAEELDMQ